MKISEQLTAAKKLIDTPAKWTKGTYCDDIRSIDKSCKFCSLGAIHKIMGKNSLAPDKNVLSIALGRAIGGFDKIAYFNDNHTHSHVMQMWDIAIKIAEEDGK